jgi:hypothetical protein
VNARNIKTDFIFLVPGYSIGFDQMPEKSFQDLNYFSFKQLGAIHRKNIESQLTGNVRLRTMRRHHTMKNSPIEKYLTKNLNNQMVVFIFDNQMVVL